MGEAFQFAQLDGVHDGCRQVDGGDVEFARREAVKHRAEAAFEPSRTTLPSQRSTHSAISRSVAPVRGCRKNEKRCKRQTHHALFY